MAQVGVGALVGARFAPDPTVVPLGSMLAVAGTTTLEHQGGAPTGARRPFRTFGASGTPRLSWSGGTPPAVTSARMVIEWQPTTSGAGNVQWEALHGEHAESAGFVTMSAFGSVIVPAPEALVKVVTDLGVFAVTAPADEQVFQLWRNTNVAGPYPDAVRLLRVLLVPTQWAPI